MTQPERSYTALEVRELVFLAAGIGSAAIMRRAPHVVMPTEDITEALEQLLADARDGVLNVG